MSQRRYDLEDRLLGFAVRVSRAAHRFPRTFMGRHVATQLVRAASSPAANYAESQAAESRRDFVHKLRVCLKELRETLTWLKFARRGGLCDADGFAPLAAECDELLAILSTCVKTATSKTRRPNLGP